MSIFATQPKAGRPRCARCHKYFTPKKEGQIYGPTCAEKEAASLAALERYGTVLEKFEERKKDAGYREVKNEAGEVTAVII